jgi:hypothetical protein
VVDSNFTICRELVRVKLADDSDLEQGLAACGALNSFFATVAQEARNQVCTVQANVLVLVLVLALCCAVLLSGCCSSAAPLLLSGCCRAVSGHSDRNTHRPLV